MSETVLKILDRAAWEARAESIPWAPIDVQDGFLHLSTPEQVDETLALHFAGREDLVVLTLDVAAIPDLRWEPSRGGQLFPHAYGETPVTAVADVRFVARVPPRMP